MKKIVKYKYEEKDRLIIFCRKISCKKITQIKIIGKIKILPN
tara:strand:+ start:1704 stop:1829 length:126 start_codon:yes stop_codon:yes gene_type:complete